MPNNLLTEGVAMVGGIGYADSGAATGSAGAATLHRMAGTITTEVLSTAAGATFTETVTDNRIAAGDIVLALVNTAGTGAPVICKTAVTAGQVVFTIQNIHASAAFSAALTIAFIVIKQS